jgi:hypothetical protein
MDAAIGRSATKHTPADWDDETMALWEFRGDFHLSEQRELSVGFGSE